MGSILILLAAGAIVLTCMALPMGLIVAGAQGAHNLTQEIQEYRRTPRLQRNFSFWKFVTGKKFW